MRIDRTDEVHENTTPRLKGTLQDADGNALTLAQVATLKVWLYNRKTGAIINGRDGQNIKNANGGTLHDTSGAFTFQTAVADVAIQDDTQTGEVHITVIRWTYGSGLEGAYVWALQIDNEVRVQ